MAVAVQTRRSSVRVGIRGSGHAPALGGGHTTNPARTLSAVVHRRRRRRRPHGLANIARVWVNLRFSARG